MTRRFDALWRPPESSLSTKTVVAPVCALKSALGQNQPSDSRMGRTGRIEEKRRLTQNAGHEHKGACTTGIPTAHLTEVKRQLRATLSRSPRVGGQCIYRESRRTWGAPAQTATDRAHSLDDPPATSFVRLCGLLAEPTCAASTMPGVAFGRAQGRSTGQTGRREQRSSWAPR